MVFLGWIVWTLACIWALIVSYSMLLVSQGYNPGGIVTDPLLQRIMGTCYIVVMLCTLILTAVSHTLQFHLLWFVPIYHLFINKWIAAQLHWFLIGRQLKERGISEDDFEKLSSMREDMIGAMKEELSSQEKELEEQSVS